MGNRSTDFGPPAKKQRHLLSDQKQQQPTQDVENRRNLVLDEVVRILQAHGGCLPLHKIGNKNLTNLRKGMVGPLRRFLESRPDLFILTEQPSEGDGTSPLVSLAHSHPL